MDDTLRDQLQTVIDKYGLTYNNYDEEEDLAPSNVLIVTGKQIGRAHV